MSWAIEFTKASRKQFEALSSADRTRIARFLTDRVAAHPVPRRLAKHLVGEVDLWRFRVGDFRIIAQFEDDRLVILVIAIGHRREVYR